MATNRLKIWTAEILTDADLNAEFGNIYIGDISRTAGYFGTDDDVPFMLGSAQDVRFEWDTTQAQDALHLGLSGSNLFILGEKADMGTNYALAARTNPSMILKSADHTATTEYLEISDGLINSQSTGLAIQHAGSTKISMDASGTQITGNFGLGIGTPSTVNHIQTNNASTTPQVEIEQLGSGDAALQWSIVGDAWAMGIDNSDSDYFKLSYAAAEGTAVLGTGDLLIISPSGYVGIRENAPTATLDVESTGAITGIRSDIPSGGTGTALECRYNDVDSMQVETVAAKTQLILNTRDVGNDVVGPYLTLGRNSNATNSGAGHIEMYDAGGTAYYLHTDDNGVLRHGTTQPKGTTDTSNGAVGATVYGTYYNSGAAVQAVGAATAEPVEWENVGETTGVTTDIVTNYDMEIVNPGVYEIILTAGQFSHSVNNTTMILTIQKDPLAGGSYADTYVKITRVIGTGGDIGSGAMSGRLDLAATDLLRCMVEADNAGNAALTDVTWMIKLVE